MKRLLLILFACSSAFVARSAPVQVFVNDGSINTPAQIPAEVRTIVNRGTISLLANTVPFKTFGTLNVSNFGGFNVNAGLIQGTPGFRFVHTPVNSGAERWMSSFFSDNSAIVAAIDPGVDSLLPFQRAVVGTSLLQIWATNITIGAGIPTPPGGSEFRASLSAGANGAIELWGKNVDLSRSGLTIIAPWMESQGSANNINQGTFTPDIAAYENYAFEGNFGNPPNHLSVTALWDGTNAFAYGDPPSSGQNASPFTLLNPVSDSYISFDPIFTTVLLTNYVFIPDPDTNVVKVTNSLDVVSYPLTLTNDYSFFPFITNIPSVMTVIGQFQTTTVTNLTFYSFVGDFSDTNVLSTNLFGTNLTVTTDIPIPVENITRVFIRSNIVKGAVFASVPPEFTVTTGISGGNGPRTLGVAFTVAISNAVTGVDELAGIAVQDTLASSDNRGLLTSTISARPPEPATTRPANYVVSRNTAGIGAPGLGTPPPDFFYSLGVLATNSLGQLVFNVANANTNLPVQPYVEFDLTPGPAMVVTAGEYAGHSVNFDSVVLRPPAVESASMSNMTGRVYIDAQVLDLTMTRIRAEGEIRITTPHLVSSTNAIIDCENLSFDLSSTNGNLIVQNLAKDSVTRFRGQINMWSALWENGVEVEFMNNYVLTNDFVVTNFFPGTTNEWVRTNWIAVAENFTNTYTVQYHTLMVDGTGLSNALPVNVFDFKTHSPNVVIDDNMRLVQNLLIDGRSLTINGNVTIPGTSIVNPITGLPYLFTPLSRWRAVNAPNLAYFTNNGTLSIANESHFGDDRATPYSMFINNGTLNTFSLAVRSTYFENAGDNITSGPLNISANNMLFAGGSDDAGGDIILRGNTATFFGAQMNAGGALVISVTNQITDSDVPSQIVFENGIRLLHKPVTGDLLASDLWSLAPDVLTPKPFHVWGGEDRGPSAAGFSDNVAIGRLTLLAAGFDSFPTYFFQGTGARNGMYVEVLDLSDLDDIGQQLVISPNLTIYYARAVLGFVPPDVDGVAQTPEEYLDGRFGGRLRWVPTYAGANSSTLVTIDGQDTFVNEALAQSWTNQGIDPSSDLQLRPIAIAVSGNGAISPFTDGQMLIVGQTNTVIAQPGSGATFLGWSGSIESTSPQLTFVMEEGLELVAHFSFEPTAGNYVGLFVLTNAVELDRAGSVSITTTKSGRYSGSVQIASGRYSFSGRLDDGGAASRPIGNSGLYIDLQAGLDQATGFISGYDWTAPFVADRTGFSKADPAPFAGKYTLVFASNGNITNTAEPYGDGYATVAVDTRGNVRLSGRLADGTAISKAGKASKQGFWPLFLPLYRGNGHLISWQLIADTGDKDIGGDYNWIKLPLNVRYYPDGFDITALSFGSRLRPVLKPITGFSEALLSLYGGYLSQPAEGSAFISNSGKVTATSTNRVRLSISKATGKFSGSVTNPDSGKRVSFSGVVLQKQESGSGFFLGGNLSGRALLRPTP